MNSSVMGWMALVWVFVWSLCPISPCAEPLREPASWTWRVVRSYPHDPSAFTQGLCFSGGILFEGTGLRGQSSVRRVDLPAGRVLSEKRLERQFFGEGITVLNDRLFQLTWQSRRGFIYGARDLEPMGSFPYAGEGWGLTHDGRHLIMSDGTATLRFIDPSSYDTVRLLGVFSSDGPVLLLNELEYVEGRIFANVWQSDRIAVIDPQTGRVTAWIDLSGLYEAQTGEAQPEVLNGIAYESRSRRLFVTGKLWKRLFEIEIVPTGSPPGTYPVSDKNR